MVYFDILTNFEDNWMKLNDNSKIQFLYLSWIMLLLKAYYNVNMAPKRTRFKNKELCRRGFCAKKKLAHLFTCIYIF